MIPYTTPSFVVTISGGVNLTQAVNVYVTLTQGSVSVTKNSTDVEISQDGKTVSVRLSQNESMKFNKGKAKLQVNWVYTENGKTIRASTEPLVVKVEEQLYKQVIT